MEKRGYSFIQQDVDITQQEPRCSSEVLPGPRIHPPIEMLWRPRAKEVSLDIPGAGGSSLSSRCGGLPWHLGGAVEGQSIGL